jgi:D-proline reductase (dithiol) PrdB
MSQQTMVSESFEEFKNSFSYGSRTDLLLKFVKNLPTEDAAQFVQELFQKIGESADDGDLGRIVDHVYEWQIRAYAPRKEASRHHVWVYESGPFVRLAKPLSRARVALLTSSGHFVAGDDPQPLGVSDMTQKEATRRIEEFLKSKPQLSVIPAETANDRLRVRHGGYDIRGAIADPNVTFPLERMRELARAGSIGELAPDAYSFVGAAAQGRIVNESGPEWAALLTERGVDAAVLVPV